MKTLLIDRNKTIESYATECIEDMDMNDLVRFAIDTIEERLNSFSDSDIIEELTDSPYNHLLNAQSK